MKFVKTISTEDERGLALFQAKLNQETLDAHLTACRKEIAELHKELRELHEQISNTGIEYEPDEFCTLEMLLAFPSRYGAYEVCRADGCREIEPHEHTQTRRWWQS